VLADEVTYQHFSGKTLVYKKNKEFLKKNAKGTSCTTALSKSIDDIVADGNYLNF